jgi:hypothetical protein
MSEVDDPHIKPGVGRKEQWAYGCRGQGPVGGEKATVPLIRAGPQ